MAETPMRFIRIDDETWRKAMARAREEGTTISTMIRTWVETYAEQTVDAELALIIVRLKQLRKRLKGES